MAFSTTKYALAQAQKIAANQDIEERLRTHLAEQMIAVARARVDAPPTSQVGYGRLVYRVIAIALGSVAVLVVVFAFVLLLRGDTPDSAFYAVGSSAIGALGGAFSATGAAGGGADGGGGGGGAGGGAPAVAAAGGAVPADPAAASGDDPGSIGPTKVTTP